jgi:hypothetical protein
MSKAIGVLATLLVGVAAWASQQPAPPKASGPNTTKPPPATVSPVTPATTPRCVVLSICPPPPPDAEGNPACYHADGRRGNASGAGIEVWYFHEPQNLSEPDKVTALVREMDGTNESQDADIEAGQQVLLTTAPTGAS